MYANLLCKASPDGNTDNVDPLRRLTCAAIAVTSTTILTRSIGNIRVLLPAQGVDGPADQRHFANVGHMFRGLPRTLASAVPQAAIELCAIDVAKNVGIAAGFSFGPGLLFCAGGAAGAL